MNKALHKWRRWRFILTASFVWGMFLSGSPVLAQVTFSDGFDDSEAEVRKRWKAGELCCDYSLELVNTPTAAGAKAAKFEYRKEDLTKLGDDNAKSDLARSNNTTIPVNQDFWIGFSMMIPEGQQLKSTGPEILFQIHAGVKKVGTCGGRPVVALNVLEDTYKFSVRHEDPCGDNAKFDVYYDTGAVVRGRYVNFVLNVKIKNDEEGYFRAWVMDGAGDDSQPKINHRKAVGYTADSKPYVRLGLYVPRMRRNPKLYSWNKIVVYFDQYREGKSYEDVAPKSTRSPSVVATPTSPNITKGVTTPFVHPGTLNNLDELAFIKDKVNKNQEPWKSGYLKMLTQDVDRIEQNSLNMKKLASLDYLPGARGCENMKTDEDAYKGISCVNTMKNDGMAAYAHALQWYIKGNPANAQKAIEILNAWSYSLKSWTGRRKRYAGYLITPMINAGEIVRYTSSGWSAKDINQFKMMLDNIIWQFIKDGHAERMNAHNSNQESSVVMGKIAVAIFLDDRAKFDDAIAHYRRHLKNNIYPDGKNYETCRDLGHTELSLAHLVMASEMAWKQGVDLYGERGSGTEPNALLRSIEYQLPYILGDRQTPRPDPVCKDDPSTTAKDYIDVRGISPYHEIAYHHYHDRRKLPATLLQRVINGKVEGLGTYRPEWGSAVGYGFGTLTHANLPVYPAGYRPRTTPTNRTRTAAARNE